MSLPIPLPNIPLPVPSLFGCGLPRCEISGLVDWRRGAALLLAAAIVLLPRHAVADWALYASSYGNNKIIKYDTNGVATVFATNGVNGVLDQPTGLVFDNLGNLYVANAGNNTIEKYDPQGNGTLFANSGGSNPQGLAFDGLNHLYVANYAGENIYRITNSSGQGSVFASGVAELDEPVGLAFDGAGNLWVASHNGGWIEKFDPQGNGASRFTRRIWQAFWASPLTAPAICMWTGGTRW